MAMHLRFFHQPQLQTYIVRLLLMVPIYATQSYISFTFPRSALILDSVRIWYEAYVLYTFLQLMMHYLGGESVILLHLERKGRIDHPWPLRNYLSSMPPDRNFLLSVRRGCLQYIFVRPAVAVIALLLESVGVYGGGHFRLTGGFLYLTLITNSSVWIAMYSLVLFYIANEDRLRPFRPLGKFLCIKAILFFSFWQSVLLASLVQMGVVNGDVHSTPTGQNFNAVQIQDWLVCVEMVGFALAHSVAFSFRDFTDPGNRHNQPLLTNLQKVLNVDDFLKEAHDTFLRPERDLMMKEIPPRTLGNRLSNTLAQVDDDDDDELEFLMTD
eukprot:GHVL01024381.1.p1 GENE.GHVL01024381.1~~GHVL01024381.1.p1  ORF type:complete len:347 (-),score=25.26 GHVL01024381.1:325-1302(-)